DEPGGARGGVSGPIAAGRARGTGRDGVSYDARPNALTKAPLRLPCTCRGRGAAAEEFRDVVVEAVLAKCAGCLPIAQLLTELRSPQRPASQQRALRAPGRSLRPVELLQVPLPRGRARPQPR